MDKVNRMDVKIHNKMYKVFFVDSTCEKLIFDDEIRSGVTYFTKKEIYIRNDLNSDSLRYTLYHEITHAYIESYGFLQVDWNDEVVADFIANYIDDIRWTANAIEKIKKMGWA